jgi:hypothetical protein
MENVAIEWRSRGADFKNVTCATDKLNSGVFRANMHHFSGSSYNTPITNALN